MESQVFRIDCADGHREDGSLPQLFRRLERRPLSTLRLAAGRGQPRRRWPWAPCSTALALGTLLDGRYRIGRVLGHGGFGITCLAWDDNLQLRIAIKEYLPRDCATRAPDGVSLAIYSGQAGEQFAYGLERFLEEARALARFDQHPSMQGLRVGWRAVERTLAKPPASTPTPPTSPDLISGRYRPLGPGGAIIEDITTGLHWMRCSQGQQWNGAIDFFLAASLYQARKISFSAAAALAGLGFGEFHYRLKEHFGAGFAIDDPVVLEDIALVRARFCGQTGASGPL